MTYLQFINTIEIVFEWDSGKNKTNIKKHGIDFKDIPELFLGPLLISEDIRKDYGEIRSIGIGSLRNISVVVIFTERKQNRIRIISARKASKKERKKYENALQNELEKTKNSQR